MTRSKSREHVFDNMLHHSRISALILSASVLMSGPAVQMASAENYANQLQLNNCGGYTIGTTYAQSRSPGGKWVTQNTINTTIAIGEGLCVDFQYYTDADDNPRVTYGDDIRLVVDIDSGESDIKCNDTNYPEYPDQPKSRRKFEMAGTTYNNNGCRSKGYYTAYVKSDCSGGGRKLSISC